MTVVPLIEPTGRAAARDVAERIVWYATFTINIFDSVNSDLSQDFFLAGHLWSIAVEEQFYLVWPVAILLFNRRALLFVCAGMIAGALAVRIVLEMSGHNVAAFVLMPSKMDALAVGALVALAVQEPMGLRTLRKWAPWTTAVALSVLAALFVALGDLTPPLDGWTRTIGLSALAMLFGSLLVYAIGAKAGDLSYNVLGSSLLTWFGKYSYALYLFHLPVATTLGWKYGDLIGDTSVYGSFFFTQIVFVLIAGAISAALAWLSWRLLEEPFLRAKSLFPYGSEASGQRLSM